MKKYTSYIENNYSNELLLIIELSKHKPDRGKINQLVTHTDFESFYALTLKHRIVSHVLHHAELINQIIPATYLDKLKKTKIEQAQRALNYTLYLIQIHEQFETQSIQHCFFKGPMLSLQLYDDIGVRNFGDIDILVEKQDAEKAKEIIEELNFECIYPKMKFTPKQQKVNYTISHHYHFKHRAKALDVELHWNISNPKSYVGIETSEILRFSDNIHVSNRILPYISHIQNLVYLSAHGAIHQWYRLFWLKDFSVLLNKSTEKEIEEAWELSKKLKLENCFIQACCMCNLFYDIIIPKSIPLKIDILKVPVQSIFMGELKQQGIKGMFQFIFYRLKLKKNLKYNFDLIFRLRTHLSDWEIIKLPDYFFFLYYLLRPFILAYRLFIKK